VDDISIIEIPVADLPVDGLLADLGNQDLGYFDLNDLLMQADATYEGHMLNVSDESDLNPDVAQTNHAAETSQSDMQHLPVNMAFPHLTIVIDDESDPNTVAI